MSIEISYWEEIKRKGVHLSSLWMVAATLLLPYFFPYGRWISCGIFAALLLLTLVSEHDYANGGKYLGRLYGILFGKMLRKEVKPGMWIVSGGAPVLMAALLVNMIFPPFIAAASMAVMLTGDAAAALVGRKFGKHKIANGKSLEGTLSFIAVGYIALSIVGIICHAPEIFYLLGIFGVISSSIAELFTEQIKIDDNFTIPLTVGIVLSLMFL
jgi:dolichol kinase